MFGVVFVVSQFVLKACAEVEIFFFFFFWVGGGKFGGKIVEIETVFEEVREKKRIETKMFASFLSFASIKVRVFECVIFFSLFSLFPRFIFLVFFFTFLFFYDGFRLAETA